MGQLKIDFARKPERMGGMYKIVLICALSALLFIGCANRYKTIYVPSGDAVKLRERVKSVKVWIKTTDGKIVPGEMDLPEGWYCLPLEKETPK